ncbi:MAG: hypothetical protein AAGG75_14140 [Bacteroidota bacterium]
MLHAGIVLEGTGLYGIANAQGHLMVDVGEDGQVVLALDGLSDDDFQGLEYLFEVLGQRSDRSDSLEIKDIISHP